MRSCPDGYEVLSGAFCSFHESEISRSTEAIAKKCKEKRPHEARFCELHKVLIF